MNRWMNDPQYLAQVGHFLGGASLIMAAMLLGGTMHIVFGAFFIGLIVATVKEYWYDLKYEIPRQSLADSSMDFFFYVLGGVAGLAVIYAARALHPALFVQ